MDWAALAEKFGVSFVFLAALGWAAAWTGKRCLGENGLLPAVIEHLFGKEGIARQVAAKHVEMCDSLQDVQAKLLQVQQAHVTNADMGCAQIRSLVDRADLICSAGIHGCDLLAAVEEQLKKTDPSTNFEPYLSRIRAALEKASGRKEEEK